MNNGLCSQTLVTSFCPRESPDSVTAEWSRGTTGYVGKRKSQRRKYCHCVRRGGIRISVSLDPYTNAHSMIGVIRFTVFPMLSHLGRRLCLPRGNPTTTACRGILLQQRWNSSMPSPFRIGEHIGNLENKGTPYVLIETSFLSNCGNQRES